MPPPPPPAPIPPPPPPPPPPKKGGSLLFLLLALLIAIGILAYSQGWFTMDKDPVTSKTQFVLHPEKFKADRQAFTQKIKDAVSSGKQKLSDLKAKRDKAPEAEKTELTKQIDAATKQLEQLEKHDVEAATIDDEKKLADLKSRIDKLLEESKARDNPKK
jgi:hypothetical protein